MSRSCSHAHLDPETLRGIDVRMADVIRQRDALRDALVAVIADVDACFCLSSQSARKAEAALAQVTDTRVGDRS